MRMLLAILLHGVLVAGLAAVGAMLLTAAVIHRAYLCVQREGWRRE